MYKTQIAKNYFPIPIINNEKDMNPVYLMLKIDFDYEMLLLNKPICIVNYQKNGMSSNIFQQYLGSPLSFAELRKLYINVENAGFIFKFRHTIHYVSSSFIAKKISQMFKEYPLKGMYIIALIPGFFLFILICLIDKINGRGQ